MVMIEFGEAATIVTTAATVLYDTNYQILKFYLRGRQATVQERTKSKFSYLWR